MIPLDIDPLFDLSGRTALVTGGSRGLGRAIVIALASRGADVAIASRKIAACEEVAGEVRDRTGRRAEAVACNVSHWSECDALVDEAYRRFPQIDILVNNAGLSPTYPSLVQVSEALYDKVLAVNLKGPFRLAALIGARMRDAGRGSIINVSSVEAIRPGTDALPYAMAKAGLNTLTEGFAKAFAPVVRVNAIMAGPFRTDIAKAWGEAGEERMRAALAMKRIGEPDEICGAALYFASDASSYCTGSVLRVDGGVQ